MAEIQTSTWSETAASNTSSPPDGCPEGWAPSTVNNWARETMAVIKREWDRTHPTITSAGTNTVTLTYTTAPTAYVRGLAFTFVVGVTNTGAATLNVNSLGATAIKKNGTTALVAGDLTAGAVVTVYYDANSNFQLTASSSIIAPPVSTSTFFLQAAASDETTALTTGTAKTTFRVPSAFTLTSARASLTTASSSGLVTVNIKKNGTTIFSTKITIDANELTSTTAATPSVLSTTAFADDDYVTVDIDGAGTSAAGLKITLIGTIP